LLSAFAGFALILAAVGLYSVVSYSVARRVREFGIRTALGASGINIVGVALRSTLFAIAGGVAMGLILSLASGTVVARWSIGNLSDPWVLGLISLVFVVIATLAASIPARRAASITPVVALRTE
jgi:putative ABC transport system permease protein